MLRVALATILLLAACSSGPPSRSAPGIVRYESAAHGWRASGQLLANQTAYDPEKDRFFIATREGSAGPLTPRLFDVATGRITDLSFECPDTNAATTVEPGGPVYRWNGLDADFGKPDAGAVFLPDDRIAFNCPDFGMPHPPPTDGKDMTIGMIFIDQPLSAHAAPRNTRVITRFTDPPWGVTLLRHLPSGGWITHRADNSTPGINQTHPVIALPGAAQFETAEFATDICPPPTPRDTAGRKCRAHIVGGAPDGRLLALLQVPRDTRGGQGFDLELDAYLLLRAEGKTLHVDGRFDTSGPVFMNEVLESAGGWIAFRDSDMRRPAQEDVDEVVLHLWNPETDAKVRIYTPLTGAFENYVIYDAAVSHSGQSVAIVAGRRNAVKVFVVPIPQTPGYHMISLADAPFVKAVGRAQDIRITRGGRVYTFNMDGIEYRGTVK